MLVMFSGGLDSTIIACLLARGSIKTVDLVNVSFQADSSADRITSIFSYFELLKMFGNRVRMICADYSIADVSKDDTVLKLLTPNNSHMDYNIGTALHYASRGEGYLFDEIFFETEEFMKLLKKITASEPGTEKQKGSYDFGLVTNKVQSIPTNLYYGAWLKSAAKVVFSGLGADEVWSGYSRYKTAILSGGSLGL